MKNRFGDYLGEVLKRREPLLIEKRGKPVAVVVDFEQWRSLREGQVSNAEHPWVGACRKLGEEIKREHPKLKSFSAAELVRQLREEES